MDNQTIISIIIMVVLAEVFIVFLFVKYKQGKIDQNPFISILMKEWKILYYAFFNWRNTNRKYNESSFSLHKNSSYFWLFLALMHEQVIEMVVLHIYIKTTAPTLAYVISALHIYSVFYIMGDYNWVRNTPITVNGHRVRMKIGARRELQFSIKDVASIQRASIQYNNSGGMEYEKNVFHVTPFPRLLTRIFGITDELKYEVIFKTPLMAIGYFGLKKKVNKAWIYIDQADELAALLQQKVEEYENIDIEELEDETKTTESVRRPIINWKLYIILLCINLLGALALSPYAIAREQFHEQMGLSKMAFTVLFTSQTFIETAVLIFLALLMANALKIKMPILSSIASKRINFYPRKIMFSFLYGLLTGGVILITSYIVSKPLGIDNSSINEPAWWLGVLGSFGAATTEETIFRLFLVTLVLWIITKIKKSHQVNGKSKVFAILVSALLFGVLHYGIASSTYDMTLGLFASMLLINGIGGIVFGAMFLFIGLEFAMIAHFSADILIHVITPLFL